MSYLFCCFKSSITNDNYNILNENENENNLKIALTKSKKDVIKKKTVVDKWNIKNKYDECIICLEDFKENDDIRILKCLHIFHKKCIDNWFDKKLICPICSYDFSS